MTQKQQAVKTTVTPQQVLNAMAQAVVDLKHWTPTQECLDVLLAHSGFETGWWASMWNNNLGNYKAVAGGSTDWCYYRCNELLRPSQIPVDWSTDPRVQIIDKGTYQEVWFDPDHPACCFMSFSTLAEGAKKYLEKLCTRYSMPNDSSSTDAWFWATQGDAGRFCHALKLHAYYTDGEAHYTSSVTNCMSHITGLKLDYSNLPMPVGELDVQPIVITGDLDEDPKDTA